MKHTLNVLTLTALAAAASAQTAPASGLNYNTVGVSRSAQANTVAIQHTLGTTNFLVGFESHSADAKSSEPQISVGYIFRSLTNGIDATVSIAQAEWEYSVYTVGLRRALNEVYAGLEISAGYASTLKSERIATFGHAGASSVGESAYSVELAYNVNSTFQVAVGLVKFNGADWNPEFYEARQTVFSVRAAF